MSRPAVAAAMASLAVLVAADAAPGQDRAGRLIAAGSDDHAWWIDRDDRGVSLWHATSLGEVDRTAPVRRVAARFATSPDAIAAVGESIWLVFPPETVERDGASVARRDVRTLSTRFNPAVGHWYSVPPNGAEPRPSLEVPWSDAGELLGFALDGPVARPEPWILLGVHPAAGRGGDPPTRLFRLSGSTWEPVEPPAGIARDGIALVRTAAGHVAILAPDAGSPDGRLVRHDRVAGGWAAPEPLEADAGSIAAFLAVDGRDATACLCGATLELAYLRRPPARSLAWTSLPRPMLSWAIVGGRDGATLITGSGETVVRTRIPQVGTFADAEVAPFRLPGFGAGAWIHLPLLSAAVLFVLLGLLFLREVHGGREAPSVAQARPFEFPRRLGALVIDAVPGVIMAWVLFDARPIDLVRVPFSALDVATAIPATVVAGSACLLGFLGEAMTGRSPGKWLLGGEVSRRDGTRAGILRHFGRNLLKFLAIVAPPLVIPSLLSPDGSGVPEWLTGTAVARRA